MRLRTTVRARGGFGKGLGAFIATFGLILTILGTVRYCELVPVTVGLRITTAYWFTSLSLI